jgi:hypothetical protein
MKTKKPTLRTALKNAPDETTKEIIILLRKLKESHNEMKKSINKKYDDNNG